MGEWETVRRGLEQRIRAVDLFLHDIYHDARILATMVADPAALGSRELDAWARDLDNYVVTDAFSTLVLRSGKGRRKFERWKNRKAEFVAMVGPNGAGKTTLFKTISGILTPSFGRIVFDGEEITRLAPHKRPHLGLAHVPEGRQVCPGLSVLENLEMGAQFPRSKKVQHKTLEQVFGYFPRLKERLYQKAGTLSGGEQQMLAMGRGLMSVPALMMLDEPSLGLAPVLVSTIFEIIKKINQRGTPILLIEQNVFNSLKISDRGYVMENGRIVATGRDGLVIRKDDAGLVLLCHDTFFTLGLVRLGGRAGRWNRSPNR